MDEFCPNFTGWLTGIQDGKPALLVRVRCKSWTCPYCAEKNASIWRASIIDSIKKKGGEWFMMTLTAHETCRSPKESLRNLQRGWGDVEDDSANWIRYKGAWWYVEGLYKMLRAYSPDSPFDYVRVYEPHRDGAIHAHFLTNYHPVDFREPRPKVTIVDPETGRTFVRKQIPDHGSRFLKDAARACGMGHQTDIKILHGHAGLAAAYVTKYLLKSVEDSHARLPKGTARIVTSHGFKEPTDSNPSDYQWTLSQGFTIEHAKRIWATGIGIQDNDLKHRVTLDDFLHFEYSPYIPKQLDE